MNFFKRTAVQATGVHICFVILAVLLLPCFSQAQMFKGHQIGEKTVDFLRSEPSIQEKLSACQATAPRELTAEEIKKRYGRKAYERYEKSRTELSADGKQLKYMDTDPDVYGDRCGALIEALVEGNGSIDGNGYSRNNRYSERLFQRSLNQTASQMISAGIIRPVQPEPNANNRNFYFNNGLLMAFSMTIEADYSSVRGDITKRLGANPTETSIPYHNAYGATWNNSLSIWNTDMLNVQLSQKGNPTEPSLPFLSIETQEANQKQLKILKNAPSTLDNK